MGVLGPSVRGRHPIHEYGQFNKGWSILSPASHPGWCLSCVQMQPRGVICRRLGPIPRGVAQKADAERSLSPDLEGDRAVMHFMIGYSVIVPKNSCVQAIVSNFK
ncbi:hypothetical protein M8818_000965 [Zalaria obscura]|uniref:Uncharacterized protein n=1 Tax=Zalaria obscura TaxID=2024903 RepID=A0ACC3SL87_9PEZI